MHAGDHEAEPPPSRILQLLLIASDCMHAGDHEAEPPPSRILILNRNLCERPATNGAANGTRVAPVAKCHSGRSVRHHKAIFRAIASNFSQWRVTDFTGTEPYREQAIAPRWQPFMIANDCH